MAAVLDLAGGPGTARAADVLVAAGLAAAVPTAATGLNDWSDTQGADRRIGLVHATANSVALTFNAASLAARLRGRRGAGRALALGGPLEEGTVDGGCVTCPWHGSTFRLADGAVVRGPATDAQPSYEARVEEGRIQVRRRP